MWPLSHPYPPSQFVTALLEKDKNIPAAKGQGAGRGPAPLQEFDEPSDTSSINKPFNKLESYSFNGIPAVPSVPVNSVIQIDQGLLCWETRVQNIE